MIKSLYKEKDTDFIAVVNGLLKNSSNKLSSWKDSVRQSYDFTNGQQLSQDDARILEDQKRPFVTFNRTAVNVNAVVGLVINNPQDILPIPVDIGDAEIDETLEGAIRYIRKLSDAEEEESESFYSLLVSGVGVIHIYVDFSSLIPKIIVEKVDELEMLWDQGNKGVRNMEKAKWVARIKRVDPEELEFLIPGVLSKLGITDRNLEGLADSPLSEMLDSTNVSHISRNQDYGDNSTAKPVNEVKGIPVTEFEWFEYSNVFKVLDPNTNQILLIPEDRYNKIKDDFNLDTYRKIKLKKKTYYKSIIVNNEIVEREVAPSQLGFSYLFATGYYNQRTNNWYGIVEFMKDPQRWANKFFSLILDIISKNAKGGAFIEKDALENPREAEHRWSHPSPLIMLKRGGVNKIRERTPGVYPSGVERMMELSVGAITESVGINPEFLGQADRRQAGVLEQTRKQSTFGIIAKYFQSLKLLRRQEGLTIIEFMKQYFSPEQLLRIDIENAQRFETVSNIFSDPDLTYDVIVDEAPSSPHVKEKVWIGLQPLLPILLKMGVPVPPRILDYAPIPISLAQEWKQLLAQTQGTPLTGQGMQGGSETNVANISPQNAQQQAQQQVAAVG